MLREVLEIQFGRNWFGARAHQWNRTVEKTAVTIDTGTATSNKPRRPGFFVTKDRRQAMLLCLRFGAAWP